MKANSFYRSASLRQKISVKKILPWFLILILLSVVLGDALKKPFDEDEFEAIHTTWKIGQGEKIYVDFFQHHHPFFYYLLLPLVKIIGSRVQTMIAARVFIFLMFTGILITTYLLAKRVANRKIAFICLLLLVSSIGFVKNAIEIRPDVPQTLCGLLAILLLFIYLEKKKLRYAAASAISLALSFLILQKAIFLIFLVGALFLWSIFKKEIPWRSLLFYISIFIIIMAPYFIYLISQGLFPLYWFLNWTLNQHFLNQFSPWATIFELLKNSSLIFVFFITGILILLFSRVKPSLKKIGLLSLGLFLTIFLVRSPYPQYLIAAFPLMAIIAASSLSALWRNYKKSITFLIVLSILIATHQLWNDFKEKNSNYTQLEKINYVLLLTSPDDYVYDGDITFNIFRRDINYFWFSVKPKRALETYQSLKPYHYDFIELITRYRPMVVSKNDMEMIKTEPIFDDYSLSTKYHDFYLRNDAD